MPNGSVWSQFDCSTALRTHGAGRTTATTDNTNRDCQTSSGTTSLMEQCHQHREGILQRQHRAARGAKYMPTSPIRGTRGGVAEGCDTGQIRGKHGERDQEPKEAWHSGPVNRDRGIRHKHAGHRIRACQKKAKDDKNLMGKSSFSNIGHKSNQRSFQWHRWG